MSRSAVVVLLCALVAACATARPPLEERSTQGPSAEQFFVASVAAENGRAPTFEERRHWEDEIDQRIGRYLREHPEAANSLNVSGFRFLKQVSVGMDREQVRILLGPPRQTLRERDELERAARKFWPLVKDSATEAWVYPFGWTMFFAGDRLADIVRYVEPAK